RPGGAAFYPLIVGEAVQRPAGGTRAGTVARRCSTDAAAAVSGAGIAAYGASAWAVVATCAPHPTVVSVVAAIMATVISVVEARVVAIIVRAIGPVVVIVGIARRVPGVPASVI